MGMPLGFGINRWYLGLRCSERENTWAVLKPAGCLFYLSGVQQSRLIYHKDEIIHFQARCT